MLATFSATAGSAAVLGNQVYGPYGNQRYTQGSMGTAKGYTGQYADATGLDYYNARYYDPIVGRFVSADTEQGIDPYTYMRGNLETMTDPTGQFFYDPETGQAARILPNRKIVFFQYNSGYYSAPTSSAGGYGIDVIADHYSSQEATVGDWIGSR